MTELVLTLATKGHLEAMWYALLLPAAVPNVTQGSVVISVYQLYSVIVS